METYRQRPLPYPRDTPMNFYAIQHAVGKIQDDPELRETFISLYDQASHHQIAAFGLRYRKHLLDHHQIANDPLFEAVTVAVERWMNGETNYHPARNLAGELQDRAREDFDPFTARFDRTIAQIAAIPHVKFHGLWVTDFGISLINRRYPEDQEAITAERQVQIQIIRKVLNS